MPEGLEVLRRTTLATSPFPRLENVLNIPLLLVWWNSRATIRCVAVVVRWLKLCGALLHLLFSPGVGQGPLLAGLIGTLLVVYMAKPLECLLSLMCVRPVVRGAPRQVRCRVLVSVLLRALGLTFRLVVSPRTFARLSLTDLHSSRSHAVYGSRAAIASHQRTPLRRYVLS